MDPCAEITWTPTSGSSVSTKAEQDLWEEILKQHDLDMDQGRNHHIDYGAQYFDSSNAFEYVKPSTNARQKNRNRVTAEKLMLLIEEGMTVYGAAKQLGMKTFNAHRAIKRYQKNFTWTPTSGSSEGKGTK